MNVIERDKNYIEGTYSRFPIALAKGKGSLVYDENGKEYIDLGTGIAVSAFGISDDVWADAVSKQASTLSHTSNLYYTDPCTRLAEILCTRTGMKKVFFGNSGAEANECAIKTARFWGHINKGADCDTIITLKNSFHGRTIATLAATGQDVFHEDFGPFPFGFEYASAYDASEVEEIAKKGNCCAVMMEMCQGEGGVYPLEKTYVEQVLGICKKYNLLTIVDEVQTGNGRSGALYAFMKYGFTPDIVSTAKGLGGGLPIGACLFGEKVEGVLSSGKHGSTFGGNPICCAGAITILERIDEKLLTQVNEKSEYIFSRLQKAKGVKSVSGIGLMIGIETDKDKSEIISACMERGLLVLSAKNKIRLLPALNIPMELLAKGMDILLSVLA